MSAPLLLARLEDAEDGTQRVLAPDVGWWSAHPPAGALLGPGSTLGELRRLQRRFRLCLPDGAAGRVVGPLPRRRVVAVEYGELLFGLSPIDAAAGPEPDAGAAALGHPAGLDLPPGSRAVLAPTDGVFYRRPAPGTPPFVEVGGRVRAGDPVGLVEVMKTFNRIVYGGPGLPDEAEVLEIRAPDAADVRAGQVLVVVR